MKPARSLAASVIALGFAGTAAAPVPAFAAPAPCERAESYAAQSGAELLRIDRLELHRVEAAGAKERPVAQEPASDSDVGSGSDNGSEENATDRILRTGPASDNGEDSDTLSEGAGMLGTAVLDSVAPSGTVLPGNTDASTADPLSAEERDEDTGGMGGGGPMTADDPEQPTSSADKGKPAGGATLSGVGLGEARTALVGTAAIKSAAIARVLDAETGAERAWTDPVLQQAPPNHERPITRTTASGRLGPVKLGAGEVTGHARWDAGMACGNAAGEAARAESAVRNASILSDADTALVRVPEKASGLSTTALEGRGGTARTVASATISAGRIDLAGGRVRVRVLRAPRLTAGMSAGGGGDVSYQPALIEVSGDGITTKRLAAVGEHADITLASEHQATESGLLDLTGLRAGKPLPVPPVAGLPTVTSPTMPVIENAGKGLRLRVEIGGVRQATKGHAIAARATALTVSLAQSAPASSGRTRSGYGGNAVTLSMGVGLLEAAAVAPEGVAGGVSGQAAGLPITGPGITGLAAAGAALLVTGLAAVLLGRRRSSHR